MARAPMKLHVKKNQLHKDIGKAIGARIAEAETAKEKSKGGVNAKRAQFAENPRKWNHPRKVETVAEGLPQQTPDAQIEQD